MSLAYFTDKPDGFARRAPAIRIGHSEIVPLTPFA